MSLTIAIQLRSLSHEVNIVAERVNDTGDQQRLKKIATELIELARRLERDARD